MVEFKMHNDEKGLRRVSRTATGYKGTIHNPTDLEDLGTDEDNITLTFGRGVEDNGAPFIEIDVFKLDESTKMIIKQLIEEALSKAGLVVAEAPPSRGETYLSLHVGHNCLSEVFEALLPISLSNGKSLIPEWYREFVLKQQKVRHGLEQSLLHAFGKEMYAGKAREDLETNGRKPRSEHNRIARLVAMFREGVPEMKENFDQRRGKDIKGMPA